MAKCLTKDQEFLNNLMSSAESKVVSAFNSVLGYDRGLDSSSLKLVDNSLKAAKKKLRKLKVALNRADDGTNPKLVRDLKDQIDPVQRNVDRYTQMIKEGAGKPVIMQKIHDKLVNHIVHLMDSQLHGPHVNPTQLFEVFKGAMERARNIKFNNLAELSKGDLASISRQVDRMIETHIKVSKEQSDVEAQHKKDLVAWEKKVKIAKKSTTITIFTITFC